MTDPTAYTEPPGRSPYSRPQRRQFGDSLAEYKWPENSPVERRVAAVQALGYGSVFGLTAQEVRQVLDILGLTAEDAAVALRGAK